jgi:actin-related protein 6
VVPKPVLPSLDSSQLLSDAAANLSSILDNAIAGSINAGWDTSNVSFSLALVSKDQEHPGVPLWEYHHLSKANTEGTKELGRDAQYLVGSVSKLVSDYVLLQTGVDIDVPVTTYIPELGKPGSKIKWDGITLRMLGSHLAGVPANCQDPFSRDT